MITNVVVLTAYCWCAKCCGVAFQPGANGRDPVVGITIAAPRAVPLGTPIVIEGIGKRMAGDRTRADIDGWDLFMGPAKKDSRLLRRAHQRAVKFGSRKVRVIY